MVPSQPRGVPWWVGLSIWRINWFRINRWSRVLCLVLTTCQNRVKLCPNSYFCGKSTRWPRAFVSVWTWNRSLLSVHSISKFAEDASDISIKVWRRQCVSYSLYLFRRQFFILFKFKHTRLCAKCWKKISSFQHGLYNVTIIYIWTWQTLMKLNLLMTFTSRRQTKTTILLSWLFDVMDFW